jgi:hypothetical protein
MTGWWRRKGPNCQLPTQSSNLSLTPAPGTEIFDAETGGRSGPIRGDCSGPKIQVPISKTRVAKETAPAWGDAGAIGGCAIGGLPRHDSDVGSQSAAAINFCMRVA